MKKFTKRAGYRPVYVKWIDCAGPDGWVYVDDAFRATAEPAYASGAHQPGGGFSGGGGSFGGGGSSGSW